MLRVLLCVPVHSRAKLFFCVLMRFVSGCGENLKHLLVFAKQNLWEVWKSTVWREVSV